MEINSEYFNQFYALLEQWARMTSMPHAELAQLNAQLQSLVTSGSVNRIEVIQIISNFLEKNPEYAIKCRLINFMLWMSKLGFGFPEFFWLAIKSNIVLELTNVSDAANVSNLLVYTGGAKATRSYLTYTLLTQDQTKWEGILMTFYPVGYMVESLKIVEQTLSSLDKHKINLDKLVYQNVLWSLGNKIMRESIFKLFLLRGFYYQIKPLLILVSQL
jgi:hypothetical protein